MTRTSAFLAALGFCLVASLLGCDAPTTLVAPVAPENPSLILVDDGTTIWDADRLDGLVRERWTCLILDDVAGDCCPYVNSETGRGPSVPTARGVDQDVLVWGYNSSTYPFLILADEVGTVIAIVEGYERWDRQFPYPTDVPALFFDMAGVPPGIHLGLPICGGGVFPTIHPEDAEGSRMGAVEIPGFGLVWDIPR